MIRICIWLPPIAASVPAKQRKEKKKKKKIAVAHSVQRNFARFEVGGWKSANGRRHRRHAVALADGFSLPLSLSFLHALWLPSYPVSVPLVRSNPRSEEKSGIGWSDLSLTHKIQQWRIHSRFSRGGEGRGKTKAEARNGIDEIQS